MKRKPLSLVVSVLLSLATLMSLFFHSTVNVTAVTSINESTFSSKLSTFMSSKFPNGSTYNDYKSSTYGYQCFGYANYLSDYIYGSFPATDMSGVNKTSGWTIKYGSSAVDSLHVGDVVRYQYHSIFITKIDGSSVYFTDANYNGNNNVRWNVKTTISNLKTLVAKNLTSGPSSINGKQYTGWVAHYSGWIDNYTLTIKYNANGGTIPSSNTTYYLNSSGLVYSVSNSTVKTMKMVQGTTYVDGLHNYTSLGISRSGYDFVGWGTSPTGGTIYDQNASMTAKTIYPNITKGNHTMTLYAIWIPHTVNFSYDANGGTGTIDGYSVNAGETFSISNNSFIKTGYSFVGWNVHRSSDNTWYCKSIGWKTAAEIEANAYAKSVYKEGNTYTLDNSWRRGGIANDTLTFYAIWEPNTLTINYNANGGIIESDIYKLSNDFVYISETDSLFTESWTYDNFHQNGLSNATTLGITREGYEFLGWGTDPDSKTFFDQDDSSIVPSMITTDIENSSCSIVLYAIWEGTNTEDDFLLGDPNGDGNINGSDSMIAKRMAAGIDTPTPLQAKALDVNGDEKINFTDTNLISRFIAGIIWEFPVNQIT